LQIRSSFLQRRTLRVCAGQLLDEADVALGHLPKYGGELQVHSAPSSYDRRIRGSGLGKAAPMSVDLKNAFRLSFVTGETALPIPPVSEILARLRSGPVWDGASIAPADDQFPLLHVEWHEGNGFVIQCYEDEQAWSDFLRTGVSCGPPTIEINLGGQALERWPSELFVPEELADQALNCFLATGKQDRALQWVRIDAFPRTIIWEGRQGREA
jgi:hypothetical protein